MRAPEVKILNDKSRAKIATRLIAADETTFYAWSALILCVAVFANRFFMLAQSPFANGLDGYSYAVQILSIRTRGVPIIVDNSPVIYLMSAIDVLVRNPVLSIKLVSAFGGALLCFGTRFLLLRAGSPQPIALLCSVAAALSPTLSFLSIDYIKNLWALALFLCGAGFIASRLAGNGDLAFYLQRVVPRTQRVSKRQRVFWSTYGRAISDLAFGLALLAFCSFSHRIGFAFSGAFLAIMGIILYGRRLWFWFALVILVCAVPLAFSLLRGGFHWSDFQRLLPAFSFGPFLPFLSPSFWQQLPAIVVVEIGLAFLVVWALGFAFRGAGPVFRAMWPLAALLCLPVWDMSSLDLGFRLFTNAVAISIVLFGLFFGEKRRVNERASTWYVGGPFERGGKRSHGLVRLRVYVTPVFWMCGVAILLLPLDRLVYRMETDPPFKLYQRITAGIQLPQDSLLIAHLGLNHFYTFTHGLKESLNYLPEFEVAPGKLWRISRGISWEAYMNRLPELAGREDLGHTLAGGYALIREDMYQLYRSRLSIEERDAIDNWYNPYQIRPDFLLQKNRD